jgi:hypothetical protein
MYFKDALDSSTLYLSGDTDNIKLQEGGFIPVTCNVNGGAESIAVFCSGKTDDQVETAYDNVCKWLRRARDRYESGRPRIYLHWEPGTGRTYKRRAAVRSGTIAKVKWESAAARVAGDVPFLITVDHECPEQDEAITLKNLVLNAMFNYDTNNDGLADNWTDLGTGAPAFVMATANKRLGRRAQRVDHSGGAASEGIKSANCAVTDTVVYEYKVDVRHTGSGSAQTVEIEVRNAAGGASVANTSTSLAESTWTTLRGTWTASFTGNIYLDLHNDGDDAAMVTQWDKAYFAVRNTYGGADYDHGMWSDYYVVDNHDDWSWDNAAGGPEGVDEQNSTDRQDLTISGCLGNLPPYLEVWVDPATNFSTTIVGLVSHSEADLLLFSLQAEDATLTNAVAATLAGSSGPAANDCIDMNVAAAMAIHARWYLKENDFLKLCGKRVRAFIIAYPKVAASYDMLWGIGHEDMSGQVTSTPAEEFTAGLTNVKWSLHAGPELYFPPVPSKTYRDGLVNGLYLDFYAEQAAGNDVYLDCVILVPTDGYWQSDMDLAAVVNGHTRFTNDGIFTVVETGADDKEVLFAAADAHGAGFDSYVLEDVIKLWIWAHDDTWSGAGSEDTDSDVTVVYRPRFATL